MNEFYEAIFRESKTANSPFTLAVLLLSKEESWSSLALHSREVVGMFQETERKSRK